MKTLIFILLVLAITVKADYSSPVKGIQDFKELYKIIAGTLDHTASIIFDHPDCYRCGQSESTFQEYAEDNEGFTSVFVVDCESMWQDADGQKSMPMCSPEHMSQLPIILLIEPSTSTGQQPQQHPYQGALSTRDLSKFLRKHMPAYRETIKNNDDYQNFLEFPQFEHKMILLTNKEKTSPLYKAVSSTYRDRILFGEVHESVSEVVSEFKFEKYPTLFLLKKQADGTHKAEKFIDEFNYKNIADYLEDFALEKKVNRAYAKKKPSSKNTENKQEKKEKEQQIEVRTLQLDKIEKQIYTIEKPVLVNVKKQGESHSQFEEIKKKYQLLFDYFEYDVQDADQEEQAKEILKVKSIPSIRFYPPGLIKKPHSSIQFRAKETDMKEIHAEIQYQIPDHTHSANDEQSMQMNFQSLLQQQKVVLLYFYDKEVSLSLRVVALQEEFTNKFGFITYKNPTDAIREQFQIQKLPHMVALFREADTQKKSALEQEDKPQEGEQVQVAGYSGKFNYKDISNFLNMWINMKEGGGSQQEKEIQELKNMNDFKKHCQGSSQCYIAILNGTPEQREDELSKLNENIKLLQRLTKRYSGKSINFVWIDGICHSEILYSLDMSDDQIPNFITYSHSKQSIAKMIGRFDIESLAKFVERANSFKVNYQALNMNDFNIKDLDCTEQHIKIIERQQESQNQVNDEDDDILKELLAEQAEKDKAQDDALKKKKKKKGSKKKKAKSDL